MKKVKFYTKHITGIVEHEGWQETTHTTQDEDITINLYNDGTTKDPFWCATEATTGLAIVYGATLRGTLRNALITLLDVATHRGIKISDFLAEYPKMELKGGN